jgi:hypothetical protein
VLMQEQLNPTLRRPEQIEQYLDVPLLANLSGENKELSDSYSRQS